MCQKYVVLSRDWIIDGLIGMNRLIEFLTEYFAVLLQGYEARIYSTPDSVFVCYGSHSSALTA